MLHKISCRREPSTPSEWFSNLPTLNTPRLLLRMITMHDAEDMFTYSSDPLVAEHVLWESSHSLEDSKAYIRGMRKQYQEGRPSSYAIIEKNSGRMIGTIGFMEYSREDNWAEVGYSLARSAWGKGYMTEALTALQKLSFEKIGFHRVEAYCDTDNPASARVLEKCGMQQEGLLRGRCINKGHYVDLYLYAILYSEWKQQNSR